MKLFKRKQRLNTLLSELKSKNKILENRVLSLENKINLLRLKQDICVECGIEKISHYSWDLNKNLCSTCYDVEIGEKD